MVVDVEFDVKSWTHITYNGCKWNESGFRPPLCTYRLNWTWRTSWGWWDDWDGTVLQTQDSKFEPWWYKAKHATSWARRLPTILSFTRGVGRNICVFFKPPRPNPSSVKGSSANHYSRAPAQYNGCGPLTGNVLIASMAVLLAFLFNLQTRKFVWGNNIKIVRLAYVSNTYAKYFNSFSARVVFGRQNLTSTGVIFWRLETLRGVNFVTLTTPW